MSVDGGNGRVGISEEWNVRDIRAEWGMIMSFVVGAEFETRSA